MRNMWLVGIVVVALIVLRACIRLYNGLVTLRTPSTTPSPRSTSR